MRAIRAALALAIVSAVAACSASGASPSAVPATLGSGPSAAVPSLAAPATASPERSPAAGVGATSVPHSSGAAVHVQLQVSGAVNGTATYTVALSDMADTATDCSQLAKGYEGSFQVPPGDGSTTLNGHVFSLDVAADKYTGPGSYDPLKFTDASGDTIDVDEIGDDEPFQSVDPASSQSLTVNPDGSGTFVFMNWQDPGSRSESGTEIWTCDS